MESALRTYARAFGLGAVSGLRSMAAPALVRAADRNAGSLILGAMALGEMIVDKLPGVPNRTSAPALIVRAGAGGYAGYAITKAAGADARAGALLGAAGAVAGAYAGLALRQKAGDALHVPDPLVAFIEDLLAFSLGSALRGSPPPPV